VKDGQKLVIDCKDNTITFMVKRNE